MSADNLVSYIKSHRCYAHPIFKNWSSSKPNQKVVGALFHQIRSFCDSTRPAHNLPEALVKNGLSKESSLVKEIAESEENHGPDLATMAGYIINKMSSLPVFSDLSNQNIIESHLKRDSDDLLGHLPGYDKSTGLLIQNKIARNVFEDRKLTDNETVLKNLGITLALEIISHRHLIPGEKHCLVDSGLYGVSLDDPEMHYLAEHWGESGAEAMHEQAARDAISSVMTSENSTLFFEGATLFLDSLVSLWDVLDSNLLSSNYVQVEAADNKAQVIIDIWQKLTLQPASKELDFFESGGDSLGAINLIVDIQKRYGTNISLEQFMRNPTLEYLSNAVEHVDVEFA